MTRYSVQPRNINFVKCYGVLSFAKNLIKSIHKNLSSKYSRGCLDHAKQSATNALKSTSKKAIQKSAETIADLIGNKSAHKITKILRNLSKNNLETFTYEEENVRLDRGIQRERFISPGKKRKYWWSKINIIV